MSANLVPVHGGVLVDRITPDPDALACRAAGPPPGLIGAVPSATNGSATVAAHRTS
jgi:hypothetical protein